MRDTQQHQPTIQSFGRARFITYPERPTKEEKTVERLKLTFYFSSNNYTKQKSNFY